MTPIRKGNASYRIETQYRRVDWHESAGITPEYVRSTQAALQGPWFDELTRSEVQGVTPEFIERRGARFSEFDSGQADRAQHADILESRGEYGEDEVS